MNFNIENISGISILKLHESRLDSHVAPELKAELMALVKDEEISNILLDLKEVDYADSSGLGAILFGIRQAREAESVIKLMNINPRVMNLIRIAKLDNIIEMFDDEKDAIASFS